MSRNPNMLLTVRGPMVALSVCCLWTLQCAGEEVSIQVPDERAPLIRYDITHATKILPVPNSELFQLPEAGIRTDTRSALARNGDIYVGGGDSCGNRRTVAKHGANGIYHSGRQEGLGYLMTMCLFWCCTAPIITTDRCYDRRIMGRRGAILLPWILVPTITVAEAGVTCISIRMAPP